MGATVRCRAHQRSNAVALQSHLLLHLRQLSAGGCQPCIRTVYAALVFQPIGIAFSKQVGRGLTHFDGLLQRLLIRSQTQQLRIGTGHVAGQQQASLRGIGLAGSQLTGSSCNCCTLLAPQIQRPAQIQRGATIVIHATRRKGIWAQVVVAELVFTGRCAGRQLRRAGRFAHAQHGLGLSHAGCGSGHVWCGFQGFRNQLVKLCIAIALPPLLRRPVHARGIARSLQSIWHRLSQRCFSTPFRNLSAGGQQDGQAQDQPALAGARVALQRRCDACCH